MLQKYSNFTVYDSKVKIDIKSNSIKLKHFFFLIKTKYSNLQVTLYITCIASIETSQISETKIKSYFS